MKHGLFLILLVVLSCSSPRSQGPKDNGPDLRLFLATQPGGNLEITVTNISDSPISIWRLNNSWGYDSFSLELMNNTGEQFRINRAPMSWTKNSPSLQKIQPGKNFSFVTQVQDPKRWGINPAIKFNSINKIRAIYSAEIDKSLIKKGRNPFPDDFLVGNFTSSWIQTPPKWLSDLDPGLVP
jgi:hypothetical protein